MIQLFSAFRKLSKGGTEIVQACDSCRMAGFCASIVLAFILRVELFDYGVDGGGSLRTWLTGSQMGDTASRWGGIKPSGCHDSAQKRVLLSLILKRSLPTKCNLMFSKVQDDCTRNQQLFLSRNR